MTYKFHVGDYVSCYIGNGKILTGYVSDYSNISMFNCHIFTFQWNDGTSSGWSGQIEEIPQNFMRIGRYEFAKPEQLKEIKKVQPEFAGLELLCTTINELVDAVNSLQKDYNKHLAAHKQYER